MGYVQGSLCQYATEQFSWIWFLREKHWYHGIRIISLVKLQICWKKMVPSQLHRTSSGADGGWLFHANGFWNFWASENPNHKDSEAPHIFTNRHIYTWLNTYSMQERNFFKTSTLKKWLGLSSWYWTSRWNFRDFGFLHDYIPQFHAIPNGYNTIQRSFFTPIESRWMKPPRRT